MAQQNSSGHDEQKRDLGHITLKIVAPDEQKRDLGHITLKIVTGGWRTAGNDESNEESSAEKCARALRWPTKIGFSGGQPEK